MKWEVWCLLVVLFCKISSQTGPLTNGQCCPKGCRCTQQLLYCYGLSLTALPDELGTCVPASVEKLLLYENQISEINGSPFVRFKNLTTLYLHDNSIHHIDRDAFKGLDKLAVLTLHLNQLSDLPLGLFDHVPSLLRLYLYNNLISQFHLGTFRSLKSLTRMSLLSNRIQSIPKDTFVGLVSLKELYLQGNMIEEIAIGGFRNLTNLRELYLGYNRLERVGGGVLYGMTKLEKLYMDHNAIAEISSSAFTDVMTVKELVLSNNYLGKITVFTFTHLVALETLDVSYNMIAVIERGAFFRQGSLIVLNLRHNHLRHVNKDTFLNLIFLKKLHLHENQIQHLPVGAFESTESLEELMLYDNELRNISCFTFRKLYKLKSLNLGANDIEWIADRAFEDLRSLVYLYLYFNDLTVITDNTFTGLSQLLFLHLQCNRIQFIERGAFKDLNKLLELQFVYSSCPSRLPCDCNAIWLQNWLGDRKDQSKHYFTGGVYCIAQDRNRTQYNILDLNRESFTCGRPRMSVNTSAEFVKLGGSVVLSCQTSPASRYRWSKGKTPYKTDNYTCVPTAGRLELKDLKREDGGQYVCIGTSENWMVAAGIDVVVSVPPYIVHPLEDEHLSGPGETARFTCDVGGTPTPEISWYKDNQRVKESDRFVRAGNSLFILNVGFEDAGNYKCVARNKLGEAVKQVARLVVGLKNTCDPLCANGGTCVAVTYGCNCRTGFEGDYCQFGTVSVSGMEPTFSGDGMIPTVSGMEPDGTEPVSGMEPTHTGSVTSSTPTTTPTVATTSTVRAASPPMTGTMVPTRVVAVDGTIPTNDGVSNPVDGKNNDNVPNNPGATLTANSTVSPTKDKVPKKTNRSKKLSTARRRGGLVKRR